MGSFLLRGLTFVLTFQLFCSQDPPTSGEAGGEMIVDSAASKLGIVCHQDYIEVTVERENYPGLDTNVTHLEDKGCVPGYRDDSKVMFKFGFEDCNTTQEDDGEHICYKNRIIAIVKDVDQEAHITRQSTRILPFECSYKKKVTISRVAFSPRASKIVTDAADYGNFTYYLDMYKDGDFDEKQEEFPVLVGIGQRLYFGARVQSGDSQLMLFPDECKATPSPDYDATPDHPIIVKACPRDKSLEYEYMMSASQRFRLDAFRFKSGYDDVYIHCKLTVCRSDNKESRCVKGCQDEGNESRRKRSLIDDFSANLYLGPFKMVEKKSDAVMDSSPPVRRASNNMFVLIGVLVGVLGVIAVGLISALVIVTKRRRPTPNGASLLVQE